MAFHKKQEFSKKDQEMAVLAKALSHPARISILRVLAKKNECTCGEIVAILPLAQSTVSQHLKELMVAGLVDSFADGRRSCYGIKWKAFEQGCNNIAQLFVILQLNQKARR